MYLYWLVIGGIVLGLGLALRTWMKRVKAYQARQEELARITEALIQQVEKEEMYWEVYRGSNPRPSRPVTKTDPEIDADLHDIPEFLREPRHN